MTKFRSLATLALLCTLVACAGGSHPPKLGKKDATKPWRAIATDSDRDKLRRWHDAWDAAVPRVKAAGQGGALDAEGALFQPDTALRDPLPPVGAYSCRVFKLGANGAAMQQFTAYAARPCTVQPGETGTHLQIDGIKQRPEGTLYADSATRGVFVGTMVLGDETRALDYGLDEKRDLIGYVEHIGDKRWRLVFPWPKFESQLDVIEITPLR